MNVPVDIVVDILSRLPVKSLIAYKSVCKLWNTTIASDPSLIELHLQRSKLEPHHHHHVLPTIYLLHQFVLGTTYYSAAMLAVYNDQQQQQHRQTAAGATASKLKPPLDIRMAMEANHVFVLGCAHWLATTKGWAETNKKMYKLLSFNMADEMFRVIAAPDSFESVKNKRAYIGLLEGCVSMCMGRPYWKCEVWVMRDYDDVEYWERVH